MYKVLIVDDEKLVVESLKRTDIWEKEGFEVIDHAYNGITAYNKIQELKPDVVFVDIRMPKMNGLELMMKTNQSPDAPLFVVISGNAEFAYAQKAIALGALGYCLKPFEPGEIISLLKSIKIKLDKVVDRNIDQLAELLFDPYINENVELNEAIQVLLRKFGIVLDLSNAITSVTILGKEIHVFASELKEFCCLVVKKSSGKTTFLINQSKLEQCIPSFHEKLATGAVDAIGISMPAVSPGQLISSVQQSEESAYQYFIYGKGKVFYYKSEDLLQIRDTMSVIFENISKRDIEGVTRNLDNIAEKIISEKGTIRHAYLIYAGIMGGILDKSTEEDKYSLSYQQMVHYYNEFNNLIRRLKEYVMEVLTPIEIKETGSSVISEIVQHINRNFYKGINIHSISRDFFINPNYFCGLFKKAMGMTFTEYVTKCRMDYACDLLKNSNLSIHEISEKVGYDNVYYFNKLFRRIKGMNPSQYKAG